MALGFESLAAYSGLPIWLIIIALTWSLIWKGFALWKSARRTNTIWFVVFLLVHTLGILEILYIYLFSEMDFDGKERKKKSTGKRRK
jgi:hypothetical protein